jgi:hypothetical protein
MTRFQISRRDQTEAQIEPYQQPVATRGGLMTGQTHKILVFPKPIRDWAGMAVGILLMACAGALLAQPQAGKVATPAKEKPRVNRTGLIQKKEQEPVYKVVSPLGDPTVKMITMVPRLTTLSGKTICTIWNGAFKSNITLPVIGELLKKNYPNSKIVPYSEFPKSQTPEAPGTPLIASPALQTALKEKGCDAVVSGNGG